MAVLSKGTTYSDGGTVTSSNLNALVDSATFVAGATDSSSTTLSGGAIIVKDLGISTAKLANTSVTTAKLAANAVTLAKLATQADQTVLANVSGGTAVPTAATIVGDILLDESSFSSNSATKGATQQSIKSYIANYALTHSGATGTFSSSTSYADLNLSSVVGTNRAMVIMEVYDANGASAISFRTNGSTLSVANVDGSTANGSSTVKLDTSDNGGTIVVVTDTGGIVEHKADASISGVKYTIQAYQRLL